MRGAVERLCDGNMCSDIVYAGIVTGILGIVSAPEFFENCLSLLSAKAFSPNSVFAMRVAEDEERFRIF
jgi:hypothetical protein